MGRIAFALLLAAASLRADLVPRSLPPRAPETGNVGTWRWVFVNNTANAEHAVPLTFWFGDEEVLSLPAGCTQTGNSRERVQCVIDVAPSSVSAELAFTIRFRAGAFGRHVADVYNATIGTYREQAVFAHDFAVTSVADSGPGTLRDAIEQVNARCAAPEPCRILFAIDAPLPANGWYTIAPKSAFPPIAAQDIVVDGTQPNDFGAPKIMLDGRELREGHGLEFRAGTVDVIDLSVGNFPHDGILALAPASETFFRITVKRNHLGVDPTGVHAAPNGWRGLQTYSSGATVMDNVISANRRAGAWFAATRELSFRDNVVGLGADRMTPLGNGASGLFVDVYPNSYAGIPIPASVFIDRNLIADNAQAGLAVTNSSELFIGRNAFHDNAGPAIDFGLNGHGGHLGLEPPAILSARYADGVTTIEGATASRSTIFLYASGQLKADGTAEAEEFLGTVSNAREFTLTVARDLRGLYITASSSTYVYGQIPPGCFCDIPEQHLYSTELSAPRRVD
jgi:hypothetical protein